VIASRRGALGAIGGGLVAMAAGGRVLAAQTPVRIDPVSRLTQGGWARGDVAPGWQVMLDGAPVPLAQGSFFVAFDRDAPASAALSAVGPAGEGRFDLPLTIAPRAWHVENVDAPFHPPAMPDAEFARIRAAEVARINAARSRGEQADGWRQPFIWPAKGRISGLFGSQRVYRGTPGSYHSGTDIAAGAGATYVAPADGVVVLAAQEPFTLEGHLLMLDHGMGLVSAFLHASALLAREGDRVAQGAPLGIVGMSGRATGPHLHWGMRWREARLDPLLFAPPLG